MIARVERQRVPWTKVMAVFEARPRAAGFCRD